MKDLRRCWAKALEDACLQYYFWLNDLRHTLPSGLAHGGYHL
jgi:hypothetical protein